MNPSDLLAYYSEKTKPTTLNNNSNELIDVVYSTLPNKPNITKKFNIEAFIFDDNFNHNHNQNNKYNNKYKKPNWKKEENENDKETNDFFDNFKGKFDHNSVNNFYIKKKNAEDLIQLSLSYSINKASNIEYSKKKLVDYNSKEIDSINKIIDVDDMFGDDNNVFDNSKENKEGKDNTESKESNSINDKLSKKDEKPFVKSDTFLNISITECIDKVNKTLNYPNDQPLWYIYHEDAESSYGPMPSNYIKEMINMNMLNDDSKIRFIDVFIYRGTEQFDFFLIKDIKRDNFLKNIRVSPLSFSISLN